MLLLRYYHVVTLLLPYCFPPYYHVVTPHYHVVTELYSNMPQKMVALNYTAQ